MIHKGTDTKDKIMYLESMEHWISHHIQSGALDTEKSAVLDIGAYLGDFTSNLLQESGIERAVLFEPNTENHEFLKNKFINNRKIKLVNCAIGEREDELQFYCNNDLATGSILSYQYKSSDAGNIKQQRVKLTTIDSYISYNPLKERISLIKIDTQGNDLNVLRGAQKTIKLHQPWLVVELIFVPLYHDQGKPEEISSWLANNKYSQCAMFNMHYSSDGLLAFADGIFIPEEKVRAFKTPFDMQRSHTQLLSENTMLRNTCEERLRLINHLHYMCEQLQKG